ncbi:hypothetical protein [Leptospira noumeaensis]|uniref:hypothetical protein n=1 Tax=Leptospira noumeaensis TaxID=2484964 RepID=UPI001FCAC6CB|nr:hypothetical protein [Leptospira noumeaensis]
MVREPWEDFRFQYGVVQNRNIELYEWELSETAKRLLRQKWNELYLVQETHIQNKKKLERDLEFSEFQTKGKNSSLPIPGFGYFTNISDPDSPIPNLFSLTKNEKEFIEKFITENEKKNGEELLTANTTSLPKTDSPYQLIHTIQTKTDSLARAEKKNFVRMYLLNPVLTYEPAFLQLNGPEFQLSEDEINIWKGYTKELTKNLRSCIFSQDCNDWEEMILLIRILYLQKSIEAKTIVFPKKNLDGFQYLPLTDLPESVKTTKQKEYANLFASRKQVFASGFDPIHFFNWESFLVRYQGYLESGVPSEGLEFNWEGYNPYRNQSQTKQYSDLKENVEKEKDYESYTEGIRKLYSYHLTHQNCTSELFRYMNEMFPDGKIGNEMIWNPLSSKMLSLNFVPAIAAKKLEFNSGTKHTKVFLSYRNLKRNKLTNFTEKHFTERFVPTSKVYKSNPLDPPFLFFTEETIWNRPIFGLANTVYGMGYTGMGILTSPFDKGQRFSKGTESVFYSLPELAFFNIRKGHFPFIAAEDIPEEYYEQKTP